MKIQITLLYYMKVPECRNAQYVSKYTELCVTTITSVITNLSNEQAITTKQRKLATNIYDDVLSKNNIN